MVTAAPGMRPISTSSSPPQSVGGVPVIDGSLQQGSSSPRPSILRKRPPDR